MPEGNEWSRREVEECVSSYLRMLTLELNGQPFNKSSFARELAQKLSGRTRPSIEFKHCNISAILLELRIPNIIGYKPRGHFQQLLHQIVVERAAEFKELLEAAEAAVLRPATGVPDIDFDRVWVPRPKSLRVGEAAAVYTPTFTALKHDYLAQESQNRSLGRAGELLVLELETRRLHAAGKKLLSNRVEHVASTQGDGLGFDVLSFEESGAERLIEVKTTSFGEMTPFYVSRTELARSQADSSSYHVYRVFDFRRSPRVFDLPGKIDANCRLDPESYRASIGVGID